MNFWLSYYHIYRHNVIFSGFFFFGFLYLNGMNWMRQKGNKTIIIMIRRWCIVMVWSLPELSTLDVMEWRFEVLESFEQIWKCNYSKMLWRIEHILWAKKRAHFLNQKDAENRTVNECRTKNDQYLKFELLRLFRRQFQGTFIKGFGYFSLNSTRSNRMS